MFDDPIQQIEKAVHNRGFGKVSYGSDDGLYVVFSYKPKKDPTKSAADGHPVYKQEEWVEIHHTGGKDVTARWVRDDDKFRFERQYRKFLNESEQIDEGLPLEHWPILNVAQVEDLKSRRIYTVEQLANTHDGGISQLGIPGVRELQKKAQAYIAATQENAPIQAIMAEKEKLEQMLTAQKESFDAQLADLKTALLTKPAVAETKKKKKKAPKPAPELEPMSPEEMLADVVEEVGEDE